MANAPQIAIKTVVVCDEVRREDNGKEILIGVYSAGVLVPQFPVPLNLTFWVQFKSAGAGELPIQFRLMAGEDVKFAEMRVQLRMLKAGLGTMAIGQIPVILQIATPLTLQMKQGDQDWITIEEISVEKGMPSNPLTGSPATLTTASR